ncbi:MAG: hypothetical protein RMN52_04485 [Anaerolineae bacterium]|nr:hypothetical protein [Candidatus Roseilinea sp.]MDW8449240.1 hypothetical protein [Anaerolineae bacterium]
MTAIKQLLNRSLAKTWRIGAGLVLGLAVTTQLAIASVGGPAQLTATPISTPTPDQPPAKATSKSDEAAIRDVAEAYIAALTRGDAAGMIAQLDKQTIAWYEGVLKSANFDKRSAFDRLDIQKKVLVLRLRNTFNAAQLKKMTVQDMLQAAVDNGWYTSDFLGTLKIAKVRVKGDRASASLQVQPDSYVVQFVRENGQWKMSLVFILNAASSILERQLERTGLKQEEALVRLLESSSGYQIDPRSFDGPLPRVERKRVATSKAALKRLLSVDDSVSVQVPESWREMSDLNPDAILQAADLLAEGYVIVIPDDKAIFADLESYVSTALAGISDRLSEANVSAPVELTLNKKPGLLHTVRGKFKGVELVFIFGFAEGEDKYYQIMTWTLPSRFERNREILLDIIKSFREE